MARAITVDANIAIRTLLPFRGTRLEAIAVWLRRGDRLVAPDLWVVEVTSGIRRAVATGEIDREEGEVTAARLFDLPIRVVPTDRDLAIAALRWADRLGQAKAYDALYVAVAERHDAPLVTADERLLARCRQLGIDFVEGLPEAGG